MIYSEKVRQARALGRALAISATYAIVDRPVVRVSMRAALDLGASLAAEAGDVGSLGCASLDLEEAYRLHAGHCGIDKRTTHAVWLGFRDSVWPQ